jgi:hypothetical protein
MFNGGYNVRAYRPGRCIIRNDTEELDIEIEKARKANVLRYAARQSAGLSIFGNSGSDSQDDLGSIAM